MSDRNGQDGSSGVQDRAGDEARAALSGLLARLFAWELDREALAGLAASDVPDVLDELEPGTRLAIETARDDEGARRELDATYCSLFALGGRSAAPPYASVWVGQSTIGEDAGRTVDQDTLGARFADLAIAWRRALGVEVEDGPWGRLPDDHIAQFLALHEAAFDAPEIRRQIETAVLRPAAAPFARALTRHGESPVYRAAGRLLAAMFD